MKRIRGQGLIEYALIVALVGISGALGMKAMGYSLRDVFCAAAQGLGSSTACSDHYLYDDFDNLDNWQVVRGNWRVEDGKLCGGPGEGRIFAEVPESGDYVITLSGAELTRGNGYGIYFRADEVEHVNGYTFQYDPGYGRGAYLIRRWYRGREFRPTAVTRAPGADWYDEPHDIKIVVQDKTFTAYVDEQKVVQASDEAWERGGVGLRTWDHTRACFDSIAVDPLP